MPVLTVVARATLSAALCVASSACTTGTEPVPEQESVPVQRYVLEGTVGYVSSWSHQHLFDELTSAHQTGSIPDEMWQRALHRAAEGAAAVHLGCASAEVTVAKANTVDVRVRQCAYPLSATTVSPSFRTVAAAQGCLVLAAPAGPVDAFMHQFFLTAGLVPPTFVESPANAGPDTWYVGPCS